MFQLEIGIEIEIFYYFRNESQHTLFMISPAYFKILHMLGLITNWPSFINVII